MSGYLPAVLLTVNGQVIPQGVDWSAPLLGIGTMTCDWGTTSHLEQAPPSTAAFSLLDFTGTWATGQDVIGLSVLMGYTATVDGNSYARSFFRGRITSVDLTRTAVTDPAGQRRSAVRIDAVCSSIETDLANRFSTDPSWPAETFSARAARIKALCNGVANAVTIRADWATAQAAKVDNPRATSLRDHLIALYNSCGGDRMIFSPQTQEYTYLSRRNTDARSAIRVFTSATPSEPRYGQGAYVGAAFTEAANGGSEVASTFGLFLPADQLEYDEGLSRAASTRITRAQVTSKDSTAADATVTTTLITPGVVEDIIGQRAVTLDSLHNVTSWAQLNASDLLAMATQEGGTWTPPPVRWRPARFGGFSQLGQFRILLRGFASNTLWALGGSRLPSMGVRPLVAVIGGRITFTGGALELGLTLAGVSANGGGNSTPAKRLQHAVTWEELDTDTAPLVWTDGPAANGMHDSLTYEDLGHAGWGLGPAGMGPDTGWDFTL